MHQLITLLVIFIIVWLVLIIFNVYNNQQPNKKYVTCFSAGISFTLWVLFVLVFGSLVLFFTKPCRMNGPVILMILIVSAVTVQIIELLSFAKVRSECEAKSCHKQSKKCSRKNKKCH
jgi:membrane protein YdbS with pleckstrin-like domain